MLCSDNLRSKPTSTRIATDHYGVHQLLVVLGVELDEHRIGTCGEVALHNLRNREQTVDHVAVHRTSLQVHSDIGAGGVAQRLGIDLKTATRDDSILYEMLHTLQYDPLGRSCIPMMGRLFLGV